MISTQMQKQYKIWGSIIVVFYVVCFGFLRIHDFQVWTLAPFIESLIGVFMGAGAIAVITGIILIFQSSIQAEQEKKQKVFDKKMNLYQSIITEMNEKFKVREGEENSMITPEERLELFFTQLNIALLSKPKTFRLFSEMLNDISDEEGKITDDAPKKLLRFIQEAREDLDVQEPMTAEDIADFSAAVKIAEKEAESLSKPYQRTMYSGFEEWKNIQKENAPKSKEGKENTLSALTIVELLHNKVNKYFENQDGFLMKYSKTGGCTGYAKGKKFLAIGFNKTTGWTHIEILKDYKEDYRLPNIPLFTTEHIRNYSPEKRSSAAFGEQFRIKANSLEVFNKNIIILLELINRSFELATTFKDKILIIYEEEKFVEYLDSNYRYDFIN
jgi:hypothetical protein